MPIMERPYLSRNARPAPSLPLWLRSAVRRMATSRTVASLVAVPSMAIAPSLAFALDCAPFTYQDVGATVCRVNVLAHPLRMFLNDAKGRPLKYFSAVNRLLAPDGEHLVFAMNAGMYHKDFSPVGLLVINGDEVSPLNLGTDAGNFFLKPNGVFL